MSAAPDQLKRRIGPGLLTAYGVGVMVGAGIYVLVGAVAANAGVWAPLAFVLVAVMLLVVILTNAFTFPHHFNLEGLVGGGVDRLSVVDQLLLVL